MKLILNEMGFDTMDNSICNEQEDIHAVISNVRTGEIPVDGIVFKTNRPIFSKDEKNIRGFEKMALIWRQPDHIREKIIGVEWKRIQNGNLIPFAVLEKPVICKGTKILKVSLKNAEIFEKISLCYNDTIEFEMYASRPSFTRILEELRVENPIPIERPVKCSVCNSPITRKGKYFKCGNQSNCESSKLEWSDEKKYKYQMEVYFYRNWKLMHLKLVADFFGAKAYRDKQKKGGGAILKFNSCNQVADIAYTMDAEKMPVKIYSSKEDYNPEINKSLAIWGRRSSTYFFHADRYNTNLDEIKEFQGIAFDDVDNVSGDIISFSYCDITKHSRIELFFSLLGINKKEPLKIVIAKPALFREKRESPSLWTRITQPLFQLS